MPEDPDDLIESIVSAVRRGDDRRINLLVHRLTTVADLPVLIRLRHRLQTH
ncbi:hypothetical protein ACFWCB_12085 [Streptomyces sp. NPDC060048]|uniref:hypothetical protein n=1 Tax=unclassified Streptomyces TaxID=2593676 RepID=UPI003675FE5C